MTGVPAYGVVLLNLGAPEDARRIPEFIRRMLCDPDVMPLPWPMRHVLAGSIARRRAGPAALHYRLIGGQSPLAPQTRVQVEALQSTLGPTVLVRHAFRHSSPFAGDVLSQMAAQGVRRVVALPAYPQAARSTRGSAVRDILRAGRRTRMQVRVAPSFPEGPGYIEALADLARPLLSADSHLVVSAHGVPLRGREKSDPYLEEVALTEKALLRRLPTGTRHSLAFQSRVGRMQWTEPSLQDEVARLAGEGVRAIVVAPISFVCENLETTYELDIELAAYAREHGLAFARVPTPGRHPAFISELARIARGVAHEARWEAEDVP